MKKNLAFILALVMLLGTVFSVIPMAATESGSAASAPAYEPQISYANINYSNGVCMMFAVPAPEAALGEGESVRLLVWGSKDDSKAFSYKDINKDVLAAEETLATINGAQYLVFKYNKLEAKDMTKIICARPIVLKSVEKVVETVIPEVKNEQGEVVTPATTKTETVVEETVSAYGDVLEYSVIEYVAAANGEFEGIAGLADEAHLALLDSMLAFGGLAQKYSGESYDFLASDKLGKIWYTPVIGGVAKDPVFGGFYKIGAADDNFVTISAPHYDDYGLVGYYDAEGAELFDSDGRAANGIQVLAVDEDTLNITVKYDYKYMGKVDANKATIEAKHAASGSNDYTDGFGNLGINLSSGNDGKFNYAGVDVIDDPYQKGNKVYNVYGNTSLALGIGASTGDWKTSLKPSIVEGFNETIDPFITVDITVARGANGQMLRTGVIRLRSDKSSHVTNLGYFSTDGSFNFYATPDATVKLPVTVSETGYTRYCFIVDFANEVLYVYAAADADGALVYQTETKTPNHKGNHASAASWMDWAMTLDRIEWCGQQSNNNMTETEKATYAADLDNDPATPVVPLMNGEEVNTAVLRDFYSKNKSMLLKGYCTYVGSPVEIYPEYFDLYDIDANDATTTTKNSQILATNFGDDKWPAALKGNTFGGIGINTSAPAAGNPLSYAGVDVIDDPYKDGNKVYSFNGNLGAVLWQAENISSAGTRPAYTQALKVSTRAPGFFDGSIYPILTYDMLVGGNGYSRMLETDTIRFRGASNTYVHLFKIGADGSIYVCTPNESYTDGVFVDTGADVKLSGGYTRIVAQADCANEQFKLFVGDEGEALKCVATLDTLWITSTGLSHAVGESTPTAKSFDSWMDMAKAIDRTEIMMDNFGANVLTEAEIASAGVETIDAATAQALYRQYRALIIKDWNSYCGFAK